MSPASIYYQFGNKLEAEVNDYHRLHNIGIAMPEMIDVDVKNERILKEYIHGDTIYSLILQDKMEEWSFENWGMKYWSKTEEFLKYAEENL